MLLEHVSCDLCGTRDYKVRYRKPDNWLRGSIYQFSVVECLSCGLVYVNPRPTLESMRHFYPRGYHDGRTTEACIRRYAVQAGILTNLTGARLLDIGCARGDFLSYLLRSGCRFDAHGVDAFSESTHDPRISFKRGLFTETGYGSDYFSLITAWAVFEHLHAPGIYFREAARTLKPGGRLIIAVTNSESIYSQYAFAEDVPRHTYHFSSRTLRKYGEMAGLTLRAVEYRDDLFDGRGFGLFKYAVGRLFGFTWENSMLNRLKPIHKVGMGIGAAIDRAVFSVHWEAGRKRSGIMVATYEKL